MFDDQSLSGRPRAMTKIHDWFMCNKIDFKWQIRLLQNVMRLLVSEIWVKWLEIVFIQPNFMLNSHGLCLPWQIVTLPTDVNGIGSVGIRVFMADHMWCFQISPYSLWLDLLDRRCRVWWWHNEGYTNCTVQFPDRFGSGLVMVWGGITMTALC